MSILVDAGTRLCVSGITGREGTFHSLRNRDYGTQVVGGVTPGKGGQDVEGIPVFNTFHDAVGQTGANTAMIFVPPRFAADSILEAEDAGIELIVMCGEIGGNAEEQAAEFIAENVSKPVVAYIAGFTAPPGKTMGHAGAIVSGSHGTAAAKAQALEGKGVRVGRTPTQVAEVAVSLLGSAAA